MQPPVTVIRVVSINNRSFSVPFPGAECEPWLMAGSLTRPRFLPRVLWRARCDD